MYPSGSCTFVEVHGLQNVLCGTSRPIHFRGVATIVLKLFNIVQPDAAFFGQKDFQQARIIQQLVRDLDVPVKIHVCPIIREPDGLALSSRNVYLSPEERRVAPLLYRVLNDTAAALAAAPDNVAARLQNGRAALSQAGFAPDYLELRDAADLSPMSRLDRGARLLAAAHLGRTRLIDNVAVTPR